MNWLSQSEEPATLRPHRSIGGVTFDVVVEEQHEDTLEITEHPVEHGANISDHAFMKPASVTIRRGRFGRFRLHCRRKGGGFRV